MIAEYGMGKATTGALTRTGDQKENTCECRDMPRLAWLDIQFCNTKPYVKMAVIGPGSDCVKEQQKWRNEPSFSGIKKT
jgi:hypothetical protein